MNYFECISRGVFFIHHLSHLREALRLIFSFLPLLSIVRCRMMDTRFRQWDPASGIAILAQLSSPKKDAISRQDILLHFFKSSP